MMTTTTKPAREMTRCAFWVEMERDDSSNHEACMKCEVCAAEMSIAGIVDPTTLLEDISAIGAQAADIGGDVWSNVEIMVNASKRTDALAAADAALELAEQLVETLKRAQAALR